MYTFRLDTIVVIVISFIVGVDIPKLFESLDHTPGDQVSEGGFRFSTPGQMSVDNRTVFGHHFDRDHPEGSGRRHIDTFIHVFDNSGCHTDRKSTRLNSSHVAISYAVFCLKKKKNNQ